MNVILQGDDVLRYHPETGMPLTPEDFVVTIDSYGCTVYHLGDYNNQVDGNHNPQTRRLQWNKL